MNRFITVGYLSDELTSVLTLFVSGLSNWQPSRFDEDVDLEVRKSESCHITDSNLSSMIYNELQWAFPKREGYSSYLNTMIRFLRYKEGDFFRAHYDEQTWGERGGESEYTLQICLNTCIGGALTFIRPSIQIECEKGAFVLFHQDLEHKVEPTQASERLVLRMDLIYRGT
jgi:hypothetical protein